jgi:hypothetical protein
VEPSRDPRSFGTQIWCWQAGLRPGLARSEPKLPRRTSQFTTCLRDDSTTMPTDPKEANRSKRVID